jgi:hypothetical protein
MKINYLLLLVASLILCGKRAEAQSNWSFRAFSLGIHPTKTTNASIIKNKIDTAGKFVIEQGVIVAWEGFAVDDKISFRLTQSIFKDGVNHLAGYSHLSLNFKLYQEQKITVKLGLGPSFFYRKDWSTIKDYKPDPAYTDKPSMQYRIIALSGELDFSYYLTKKVDLNFSVHHIEPEAFTLAIGLTYWLEKKSGKSCNCPGVRKK